MAGDGGHVWEVELQQQLEAQRAGFQRVVDEANATIKRLRRVIDDEHERHSATQAELENLKKGSIAMMKYVTSLQRKKHDEELDSLKERVREAQRAAVPKGGSTGKGRGRDSLERRAAELDAREREIDEQFARMSEERELRRAEADSRFTSEMDQLPEMQKIIVEKDAVRKQLSARLREVEAEARRLKLFEAVGRQRMAEGPGGRDLQLELQAWDDEIVRLRHELATRDLVIEEMRQAFDAKLRNSIALQRIKYEEEIADLKARADAQRPRLSLRRK
jgi:hypothetical protein